MSGLLKAEPIRESTYSALLRSKDLATTLALASTCKVLNWELRNLILYLRPRDINQYRAVQRWYAMTAALILRPMLLHATRGRVHKHNAKYPIGLCLALAQGEEHFIQACQNWQLDQKEWRAKTLNFAATVGYEAPFSAWLSQYCNSNRSNSTSEYQDRNPYQQHQHICTLIEKHGISAKLGAQLKAFGHKNYFGQFNPRSITWQQLEKDIRYRCYANKQWVLLRHEDAKRLFALFQIVDNEFDILTDCSLQLDMIAELCIIFNWKFVRLPINGRKLYPLCCEWHNWLSYCHNSLRISSSAELNFQDPFILFSAPDCYKTGIRIYPYVPRID